MSAVKSSLWTPEEDALLAHYQAQVGNKWSEVAKFIGTKTGQQCAQRWRHRVNPNISKEKWTEEEDRRLASLVRQHGSSWAEIARHLPGRTDQQCMGRWRRHLDPNVKKAGWQHSEDETLRRLVAENGAVWSHISRFLQGRTPQQVRARWCQLEGAESTPASARARARRDPETTPGCNESVRHLRFDEEQPASEQRAGTNAPKGATDEEFSSPEYHGRPTTLRTASKAGLICKTGLESNTLEGHNNNKSTAALLAVAQAARLEVPVIASKTTTTTTTIERSVMPTMNAGTPAIPTVMRASIVSPASLDNKQIIAQPVMVSRRLPSSGSGAAMPVNGAAPPLQQRLSPEAGPQPTSADHNPNPSVPSPRSLRDPRRLSSQSGAAVPAAAQSQSPRAPTTVSVRSQERKSDTNAGVATKTTHNNPPGMTPIKIPTVVENHAQSLLSPPLLSMFRSPPNSSRGSSFASPQFQGLLTPEWARLGQRGPGSVAGTSRQKDAEFYQGRAAVTRRLPLDSMAAASDGSGSPTKKARRTPGSPHGLFPFAPANPAHLLQPETVGRAQLAAALQAGLGLEVRVPAGKADESRPVVSAKGTAGLEELNSRSVRMRLHALLENA